MIKRILYNDNLISLGSAVHYDGEPVWSDGRVAYGWEFPPAAPAVAVGNVSGFWVGEEQSFGYRLCQKNLSLTKKKAGFSAFYEAVAFPCYATVEGPAAPYLNNYIFNTLSKQGYKFDGCVLWLNKDGDAIVYNDEHVFFYSFSNYCKADSHGLPLRLCEPRVYDNDGNVVDQDGFGASYTMSSDGEDVYVYSHLDTMSEDFSSPFAEIHNGIVTCDSYTGQGSITTNKSVWLVDPQMSDVDISSLDAGDTILRGIFAVDVYDNNGVGVIGQYMSSNEARTYFTFPKKNEIRLSALTQKKDSHDLVMMSGDVTLYNLSSVLWSGVAIVAGDILSGQYVYDLSYNQIAECVNGTLDYNGQQYNGSVTITSARPVREQTFHKITPSGVSEESFPSSYDIGGGGSLSLPSMTLSYYTEDSGGHRTQHVETGDPLGLLSSPPYFVYPWGVHGCLKDGDFYVITQQGEKIYKFPHSGASGNASYSGIGNVFSLEWLNKPWLWFL